LGIGKNSKKYQYYYTLSALELEDVLNDVQTIKRGNSFADGQKVLIKKNNSPIELKMTLMAQHKTSEVINWVIYLFICIYIIIFLQSLWLLFDSISQNLHNIIIFESVAH
jgi:predicted CopG family antitoxin